jgi:hypothetical protein
MADLTVTIERLYERHPGLTSALGDTYAEAACVCFARFHEPPIALKLQHGSTARNGNLAFTIPDVRTQNAHANEIDATETGAYGVSLASLEALSGLVAVRRAETLTGADWYVAPVGTPIDDFEECIRLEVSGISAGTSADIQRRLNEKVAQAARGQSNLPAIAAVVGFKVLEVAMSPLREST